MFSSGTQVWQFVSSLSCYCLCGHYNGTGGSSSPYHRVRSQLITCWGGVEVVGAVNLDNSRRYTTQILMPLISSGSFPILHFFLLYCYDSLHFILFSCSFNFYFPSSCICIHHCFRNFDQE